MSGKLIVPFIKDKKSSWMYSFCCSSRLWQSQQVAKEMHNILTMYSVYSDGILLTPYKGEIIYSTLYSYGKEKVIMLWLIFMYLVVIATGVASRYVEYVKEIN